MEKKNMGHPGLEAAADAACLADAKAPVPTKTSEILSAAADLVARPGGWTQGVPARNASGEQTHPLSSDAACFCMAGAISRAIGAEDPAAYRAARLALVAVLPATDPAMPIVAFNDARGRTAHEVAEMFRQAAEKAREAGQ